MEIHHISLQHLNAHHCLVEQDGHQLPLDSPAKEGVTPKKLLLSSLAGCTAMDVAGILDKMRVAYSDFRIEVDGHLGEEHPKTYQAFDLKYIIRLANASDQDKVQKAIDLSQEKYCGVSAMLRKIAPINISIVYI